MSRSENDTAAGSHEEDTEEQTEERKSELSKFTKKIK